MWRSRTQAITSAGQQVVEGPSIDHASPQLGGRDLQPGTSTWTQSQPSGIDRRREPGPVDHHQRGQRPRTSSTRSQLGSPVAASAPRTRNSSAPGWRSAQLRQGVGGVAVAAAVDLEVARLQARAPHARRPRPWPGGRRGELIARVPTFCHGSLATTSRSRSSRQAVAHVDRGHQVADVGRIEGPPEHADPLARVAGHGHTVRRRRTRPTRRTDWDHPRVVWDTGDPPIPPLPARSDQVGTVCSAHARRVGNEHADAATSSTVSL